MSFAQESGYTPITIEAMMDDVMENVNTQFGTTYTTETFIGTNFYKYFYALIQRLQENEIKTSEIFSYLQDYFRITNERISRPVVTPPGIIEAIEAAGYLCSVKPMETGDAGEVNICVDKIIVVGEEEEPILWEDSDDYDDDKLEVCTIIKNSVCAGIVSQGAESETIVLSNGQPFDFKYTLPTRIPKYLKLTIVTSDNNQIVILSPEEIKDILITNIEARYRLGMDFEPQRYFSVVDAPWAASVLLEHSADNMSFASTVIENDFDELITYELENITLVET